MIKQQTQGNNIKSEREQHMNKKTTSKKTKSMLSREGDNKSSYIFLHLVYGT